jgi:hypothetical protein
MLHTHSGYSVEHGEDVALNLIERAPLILRRDREARRGGPTETFFALRHGVVKWGPDSDEYLQFRKVLLDDAQ